PDCNLPGENHHVSQSQRGTHREHPRDHPLPRMSLPSLTANDLARPPIQMPLQRSAKNLDKNTQSRTHPHPFRPVSCTAERGASDPRPTRFIVSRPEHNLMTLTEINYQKNAQPRTYPTAHHPVSCRADRGRFIASRPEHNLMTPHGNQQPKKT